MTDEKQQQINTKLQDAKNGYLTDTTDCEYKCNNCNYTGKIISTNKYHRFIFGLLILFILYYIISFFTNPDKIVQLLHNDLFTLVPNADTTTVLDEKTINNIIGFVVPFLSAFLFMILFSIRKVKYKCPSCDFTVQEDAHIKKIFKQIEFIHNNTIENFEYIDDSKDNKEITKVNE